MNYKSIVSFFLISPSLIIVFFAILNIPFPGELTVCAISLVGVTLIKLKAKHYKFTTAGHKFLFLILFFCSVILFYTLYSLSTSFVYLKLILVCYLVFLKLVVISLVDFKVVFYQFDTFIAKLKNYSVLAMFIFFTLFILGFTEKPDSDAREYLVGIGNPIWFSRFVSDFMFIIVFFVFKKKKLTLINLAAIACGCYLIFASGSRGPALSLLLVCFLCSLYWYPHLKKKLYVFLIMFIIFIAPFIAPIVMDFNIYSLTERLEHIRLSSELIRSNAFGYGFGSYGLLSLGIDERAYPHNVFIEVFLELGVVGLIAFVLLIVYGFTTRQKENIFFFLFLMSLLNAQFSGDLASNGYIFLYLLLSILFYRFKRKTS